MRAPEFIHRISHRHVFQCVFRKFHVCLTELKRPKLGIPGTETLPSQIKVSCVVNKWYIHVTHTINSGGRFVSKRCGSNSTILDNDGMLGSNAENNSAINRN